MVVVSQTILNMAAIKVKSEELRIPFANLALAFVIEEFLVHVSESEYAPYLWICNAGNYGLDSYRRKLAEGIRFFYQRDLSIREDVGNSAGSPLNLDLVDRMMREICEPDQRQNIRWEYDISGELPAFTVNAAALFENFRIPFQIRIETLRNEKLKPYTINFRLCIRNNDQLRLNSYPMEFAAADCLFEIIEKLELINEMDNYMKLYLILKNQTLDGRKVQLELLEKCSEKGLEISQRRLKILLGYRGYAYMIKKWKAYLKRENKKCPKWEEVVHMIEVFLSPIWKMMCEDLIFIGDWMPEISRFLE